MTQTLTVFILSIICMIAGGVLNILDKKDSNEGALPMFVGMVAFVISGFKLLF